MENNKVGQNLPQETPVSEGQVSPRKKIRIKRILLIILLVLLVLGVAAFAGFIYLRSSPQLQNISKDALMVTRVDLPMLIKKAGLIDLKKDSENEDLREILEELNMEALIDDPKSTGIFTLKPAYYFMEYDDRDSLLFQYLVLFIVDGKKLGKFLEGIMLPGNEEFDVETKGKNHTLDLQDASCVWNKSTLIVAISDTEDNDELTDRAAKLLEQPSSKSIKSNKFFRARDLAKHDFSIWVNTERLASITEKGFKDAKPRVKEMQKKRAAYYEQVAKYRAARERYYQQMRNYMYSDYYYYGYGYPQFNMEYPKMDYDPPRNVFEQVLLEFDEDSFISTDEIIGLVSEFRSSSYIVYADFKKGSIKVGIDSDFSPTQEKKYGKIMQTISGTAKLAKYLPKERQFATGVFQGSWDEAWKVFGKQVNRIIDEPQSKVDQYNMESGADNLERYTKHLKNLCEGNLMASVNIGAGKQKYPFISIAGHVKKNKGALDILKQLDRDKTYKKSGNAYKAKYGSSAFVVNDDVIVWTSNYEQYKKSEQGLESKSIRGLKSSPLGAVIDLAKLVTLAEDKMNLDRDTEDILEQLVDVRLETKMHKGLPAKIEAELRLKERKKNSLKVIWEIITDKTDIMENLDDIFYVIQPASKPVDDVVDERFEYEEEVVDTLAVADGDEHEYGY